MTTKTDSTGNAPFSVQTGTLTLSSPGLPRLYRVNLTSGADTLTDDIGFRDIRVEGTHILLNGDPVFLKDINVCTEVIPDPVHLGFEVMNDFGL